MRTLQFKEVKSNLSGSKVSIVGDQVKRGAHCPVPLTPQAFSFLSHLWWEPDTCTYAVRPSQRVGRRQGENSMSPFLKDWDSIQFMSSALGPSSVLPAEEGRNIYLTRNSVGREARVSNFAGHRCSGCLLPLWTKKFCLNVRPNFYPALCVFAFIGLRHGENLMYADH